ncbi:MAG TPA: DMT family transporter [Rubricoccaceae bacterium]
MSGPDSVTTTSGAPAAGSAAAERPRAIAALVAAGTLWGTTYIAGKIALEQTGPVWLIVFRLALASGVLLPLVPWRRIGAQVRTGGVTGSDAWRVVAGALVSGYIVFVMQFEGLARTTAASASLLVAVAPPLLAIGAALVDGERASRAAWAAVALSALGVVLLVGEPGPGRSVLGDALCAASMAGAVGWTLLSRRVAHRIGALPAMAVQFALAGVLVLPWAFWREGPPPALSGGALAAVVWMGIACTAGTFVLFTWGVMRVEAARAGVLSNVEPVIGSALGVWLLGETLGPWALAGGALLVVAAVVAVRAGPARPHVAEP